MLSTKLISAKCHVPLIELWYNKNRWEFFKRKGVIFVCDYLNPCKRIWEGYKTYAKSASVIRKGFELVGASVNTDDSLDFASTFYRRSESTLEHQAKTAWLASAFMSNFPDFFGIELTFNFTMGDWLVITTALCHDVGETAIGDIPDDGNSLHDTKDEAEHAVFKDFIKAYGYADQRRLLELFESFQKRDYNPARALYALDKVEAVLTLLLLESVGIKGSIEMKNNPTSRDSFFAKAIGSDLAADIWGAQMSNQIKSYPSHISEPVLTLLNVAARDIRNGEFSWLQESS